MIMAQYAMQAATKRDRTGTIYASHRAPLPRPRFGRRPDSAEPVPNVVLIGSPNQDLRLREVHKGLAHFPGVVACSRILDLSAYTKQNLVDFADHNSEAGRDQKKLNASMDALILAAATTARVALVVNIEPDSSEPFSAPLSGDIRPEEHWGQIAPMRETGMPVLFMNELPGSSHFRELTRSYNGLPPENVVGGCLAAVACLAVNGPIS